MTIQKKHIVFDLIAFIAIIFIVYMLQNFLVPILFAIILSVLIFPIVRFFEKKLCFNRVLATTFAVLIFSVLIFCVFVLIGIQIDEIMSKSNSYYDKLEKQIMLLLQQTEVSTGIKTKDIVSKDDIKVDKVVKENYEKIFNFITASGSIISDFIFTPLYMFFILLYRKFLLSFIYRITSNIFEKKETKHILQQLYIVQQNYMLGLVSVMVIVGLLNSVGLLILGIDYPFFFGFLGAFLLLIPYIGIIIGSLLPALIALATKDSGWYALGVIAVFGFIQILEGNFITPKITGSKVSLNSFISIIAIVLFSMLFGISGMILALPVTASLKILFDHSENYKAFGFLLGMPSDEYFSSKSKVRLKVWKKIRKQKLLNKSN